MGFRCKALITDRFIYRDHLTFLTHLSYVDIHACTLFFTKTEADESGEELAVVSHKSSSLCTCINNKYSLLPTAFHEVKELTRQSEVQQNQEYCIYAMRPSTFYALYLRVTHVV